MKLICDRSALGESLGLVSAVVVARTPKPALRCVKMTASDSKLTLSATDLEVAVRVTTPRVEVQEPGESLVVADKLNQIVRESIDPTLAIEVNSDSLAIATQDSHFKVFTSPTDDFPPMPDFEGDPDFEISTSDLQRLISKTIFATARESSRYAINGVLIERDGKKLVVVATDGRRLALAKGDCRAANGDNRSAIVPTKALTLLLRVFDDADQTVRVRIADNQILFATDEAMVTSNLVEGNFPPYRDVVPKDGDRRATLNTDTFASAVRRAALLTNEESKGVNMAFSAEGLKLSSRAPELGEAQINIDVPEYSGESVEIGFNPQFILDALKIVDTDQVNVELQAPNKPGMIRTGSDFLYVVMPVSLD